MNINIMINMTWTPFCKKEKKNQAARTIIVIIIITIIITLWEPTQCLDQPQGEALWPLEGSLDEHPDGAITDKSC